MAQVDYFLKLDGIKGESRDDKHKDEIDILSYSWGETQAGTFAFGGGGGAGKVQMQDFHFTTKYSKASPLMFFSCASGEHIKSAVLTARKAGEQQFEFLKVELNDVMITSYQTGGSGGTDLPTEQVSLNFAQIKFEYKEQDETGKPAETIRRGWDLKKATGI